MFHSEVGRRDGVQVGYVRAASYGHTLGGAVGLAMVDGSGGGGAVDEAYLTTGRWEVEIAGRLYPAVASLRPMYDPGMGRIKGD
jgi:glycine cleavage system aminomethyltransferase T